MHDPCHRHACRFLRGFLPDTHARWRLSRMPEGATALAAVERLDERFAAAVGGQAGRGVLVPCDTLPPADATYDVIYLGGVLGLINATALLAGAAGAADALRVAVIDEAKAGYAHREWNISRAELHELIAAGVLMERTSMRSLPHAIRRESFAFMRRTRAWLRCRSIRPMCSMWRCGRTRLLAHCRARFLALGGTLIEGRRFRQLHRGVKGRSHRSSQSRGRRVRPSTTALVSWSMRWAPSPRLRGRSTQKGQFRASALR